MSRQYEVRPKAVVTVADDGTVTVDVDLINLPFEMENDYLAGHDADTVTDDVQAVRTAFMQSPLNHYAHIALTA